MRYKVGDLAELLSVLGYKDLAVLSVVDRVESGELHGREIPDLAVNDRLNILQIVR
jgi:hypothetical protein